RVVMPAAVEKKGGDLLYLTPVQPTLALERPPHHVDDTHYHRSQPRPLHTTSGGENLAGVRADPAEPCRSSVALGYRVGRDEAKGAALAQQRKGAAEKLGHDVCVPVCPWVQGQDPIEVV